MNLDDFAQQIQAMQQRVAQMQRHTSELLSPQQQLEITTIAFEELSIALEELQVTFEELHQQNETLFVAHQTVELQHQRYQELFEFAPDAYLVTDINGVIQEANRAASTLLNSSPPFLVGKPLSLYVAEEERRAFRTQLNQLSQMDGVQEWEVCLKPTKRTPIIAALRVVAVSNREGQPGCLRWLVRDISDRKQTELELRWANERLQLAATALNGTIYDWDINNRIVHRTQGLIDALGYAAEDAEPTPDWWAKRIHPDDRQRVRHEISEALASKTDFATEYQIRGKDNQYLYVWDKGLIMRNASGRAMRVVGCTLNITRRKQAEMARQESVRDAARSAALLHTVITNVPIILYALDREGVTTLSEGQGLERLGLKPGQVVGQSVFELYPNRPDILENIRRTLAGAEITGIIEMGDVVYDSRTTPLRDDNGQVMGLIGISTDITEFKRAEEALQKLNEELENRVRERTESLEQLNEQLRVEIHRRARVETALRQREQEFRALVENAPDVIERFDRELRHVYVNPAVEKATGKSPTEFIGKKNRELGMSQANTFLWEEVLKKIFETGQEEQIEFSVVTPKGLKYYQTRFVPELAADGSTETVLGISRDITVRKSALDALRESEERFRQLAENIDQVFWMVTSDSNQILYISPTYEKIWDRSCESLYDQPESWTAAVHPQDREISMTKLERQSRGEFTDVEYRIVRPDGSIRWIRDRGFPIHDEQGRVYRFAGIAEDITSRKQAELETYKMLQRERELGNLKSRFVSMTSHEFRTPLATIQSSAELLERYRQKFSQEKQLTHLHRIQTAVERMTQMLNDILIIGEAEAGKLEFNPTPIDVVQFCHDLVEELQQNGELHRISFTSQYPSISISSDEKLLRHILSNLLSNAIKYSPTGTTVQFSLTCQDATAIFQIQDNGIGIPPEDVLRLFESFHRATNVGTIQGTGLGLAIVKQCVDLHKGKITVNSEVGKGTTFTVTLPLNN